MNKLLVLLFLYLPLISMANPDGFMIEKSTEALYIQSGIQKNLINYIDVKKNNLMHIYPDYKYVIQNTVWIVDSILIKRRIEIRIGF